MKSFTIISIPLKIDVQRTFVVLIILFPIFYLVHNFEEWMVFKSSYLSIYLNLPAAAQTLLSDNSDRVVVAFKIALIVASFLPMIISILIWGKISIIKINILLVISFVTIINTISHISSSLFLGFMSPGFLSGVFLLLPYSIAILYFAISNFRIRLRNYLLIIFLSILIFIGGLAASWFLGLILS
ncbi:MAG: HXXEE domain-containing protein [Tenuifilaceae bacterium]